MKINFNILNCFETAYKKFGEFGSEFAEFYGNFVVREFLH